MFKSQSSHRKPGDEKMIWHRKQEMFQSPVFSNIFCTNFTSHEKIAPHMHLNNGDSQRFRTDASLLVPSAVQARIMFKDCFWLLLDFSEIRESALLSSTRLE
jgi:hypothetical protein